MEVTGLMGIRRGDGLVVAIFAESGQGSGAYPTVTAVSGGGVTFTKAATYQLEPFPYFTMELWVGTDSSGGQTTVTAQLAGGALARAPGGPGRLALFAGEVLRADGPRLGLRQPREVAEVHVQAVETLAGRRRLRGRGAARQDAEGGGPQKDSRLHRRCSLQEVKCFCGH